MKKRLLTFCLAIALILSMIPAAGAAYAAQTYTVIATGIEATEVDILDNGYCGYKVLDGYEIPRKGIIAPSGKAVVTLDFTDDPVYMGVLGTTHAVGYGNVMIDLPEYTRHSADGSDAWGDAPIYDTDGNLKGHVIDLIKNYEGLGRDDVLSFSHAYWGNDGYLTVCAGKPNGDRKSAYVIDLRKMEICFSMHTYDTWGGEGAEIKGVYDGLLSYRKTYSTYGDDGWNTTITEAGWMDLSGKQVLAIDPGQYSEWGDFSDGRAAVYKDSALAYGYFDKSGKLVIPCEYDEAGVFMDGYAVVSKYIKNQLSTVGYIDTSGKNVIPFQYEDARGYGEGLFTVANRTLKHADDMFYSTVYGMVDKNNATVVPFEYDDITPVRNGVAYAIKDRKVFVLKFAEPAPVDPNAVENIFKDVPAGAWYAKFLQKAYDSKIIAGTSATTYAPTANLNHGQIMVMAANLHSRQKQDRYDFQANKKAGDAWYQVFEDYCKAEGIIDGRFDGAETRNVTRAEMAYYFANTLTDSSYKNKKTVELNDIAGNPYEAEIVKLAKADIVGGKGEGKYDPSGLITRAEAAVFVSNILDAIE